MIVKALLTADCIYRKSRKILRNELNHKIYQQKKRKIMKAVNPNIYGLNVYVKKGKKNCLLIMLA